MSSGGNEAGSWSRPAFAIALLILLAFAFNWPYLTGGFAGDDLIFLNLMDRDPLPYSRWRGVWSMNDYPFMDHLWWKDWKDPGGDGIFWRPLPSLAIEGSIRLFGRHAFPLHLLSILLHGLASAGIYGLVRKWTRRNGLALLAGLFFVACEDHSMGVGWIATIPDLFCVPFILLALLGYTHWLQHRRPGAMAGSLAALAAAMACKETASVAPPAMVLLAFFMPSGSSEDRFTRSPLRRRLARLIRDVPSWLPPFLMLAGYLALFRAMGLGSLNTLVYINPLVDPLRYLARLLQHLPVMWLGTFTPVPPFLTMMMPGTLPLLAILGLLVFLAWLAALWPLRNHSLAGWAVVAYLVVLLPQLGADASERGLYFPMVPASILLALVMMTIAPLARRMIPRPAPCPRFTRFVGWSALAGVLVPGAILSLAMPWMFLPGFTKPAREFGTALPHIERHRPEHVLVLNASSSMLNLYAWDTLHYLSGRPVDAWLLSAAAGVFSVERTGEASFRIRTDRDGWLDNVFTRILRTRSRLKQGERYETLLFTATLEKMTRDGGDVLAVRFDLERPLDDPAWLFLRWNGEAFEPLDIAALRAGETRELADTSDIWKSMF